MTEKEKTPFRKSLNLIGFGIRTAHRLMPFYFPCVILRSIITSAQPLLVLFFSAQILNELNGAQNVQTIIVYVVLTVGSTFLLSVLKAFLVRAVDAIADWEQALRRIDMAVSERFASMDFAHTENSSVSEILARMDIMTKSSGRGLIYMFINTPRTMERIFSLVFSALLLGGSLSSSGIGQAPAWGIFALLGLFGFGIIGGLRLRAREAVQLQKIFEQSASINTMADYYFEYVTASKAAKDIRFYKQSELLGGIFEESLSVESWLSFFRFMGHSSGFSAGLLAAIGGGFYLLVGYAALGGNVPVGSVVQTVGAVTALTGAIGALTGQIGELFSNAPFLEPMQMFMNLPDILIKGEKDLPKQSDIGFEFRNVSFKYPNSELYALREVNLRLNSGERLAIVGLNGSGKSTFVKLLCRLYDPTEGEVLLDGENIKEFDYEKYIELFSVVFQDYKLFPLPLGQNVAAAGDFNEARLFETLSCAGFSKRLSTMPDSLNTVLFKDYDEKGTTISGGEAQKIALARALYKDAPVVVLDEPTAALDPIAEYEVYTTFDRTIGNKTAVFISHRLSSCRFCHRIAVFNGGRLVQLGTHEELLENINGQYAELWEAQASHYRNGDKNNFE